MRRRDFIAVLGGAAAALPFAALAQQQTPLVGFLNSASPDTYRFNADSFREGLAKAGFVEGRNVRIEERWARGDYGALPALAAELVATGVVAIAATGDVASARAAQLASTAVPVVFTIGGDPVRHGLIETMNRPGRHVTGILFNQNVLGAKRVELLREIAPSVSRIALLMNPTNPNVKVEEADAEAGAKKLGVETITVNARNASEIEPAFEQLLSAKAEALITGTDPILLDRREADCFARTEAQGAGDGLCAADLRGRRPSELWPEHQLDVPPGRRLRRADSERRKSSRNAGLAADTFRAGDQPEDCQRAGPYGATNAARPRR